MAPQKHRPALLAALAAGAVVTSTGLVLPAASAEGTAPPPAPAAGATAAGETAVELLYFNDYHGRLSSDPLLFAGAIEQLRAENEDGTLLLSGGDNVGASEYVSAVQQDDPTLDVLDALELDASAVGNHEFDRGADDLTGRITERADFPYLAANVTGPDGELVTEASATFDVEGVRVGVVGAVTQQTATLVSPGAIEGITFGDPVEAVNAEAERLEADGADVVVAVYHEGAADAADALGDRLVTGTSATVDVVLNGHTHQVYDEGVDVDGDGDLDRAVLQAGSYGGSLGRISLSYDEAADDVDLTTGVLAVDEVVTATEEELVARYPRVAEVAGIVADAEAVALERGSTPVGEITGDITTAYGLRDGVQARDDRGAESSLGNLVAESIRDSLDGSDGVQIGLINPGGLRADLLWADDPDQAIDGERDGVVTESEANQVMPFANNLNTVTLTGEQFERVLEQQWQPEGSSRPYLQLGLSENVSYTFDAARPAGERITSITVDGQPVDPAAEYVIGSVSFLVEGGDNFTALTEGTDVTDTGRIDRDAWMEYLAARSADAPIAPEFDRRSVSLGDAAAEACTVEFEVAQLDMTSLGAPATTEVSVREGGPEGTEIGTAAVAEGAATVAVDASALAEGAPVWLVAAPSGTRVRVPEQVLALAEGCAPVPAPTDGTGEEPAPAPEPGAGTPPVELAIREIQGTGDVSPVAGQAVTTRGVVTAVYATGGLNGYYVQTPGTGGDLDPAAHDASDGVFVHSPDTAAAAQPGQFVEVTGEVAEHHGQTQLRVRTDGLTVLDEPAGTVEPAAVGWPAGEAEREDLEGMLLDPAGAFVVTDNHDLNRYGEIGLAAGTTPLVQPTAVGVPGSPEAAAQAADNAARGVLLDDGATTNYGNFANADTALPYLSPETPMRIGAPVEFVAPVVLGYGFDEWRLQPTTHLTGDNARNSPIVAENTRTAAPEDVGGTVQLATFNVLNYFTTTGEELTGCNYYTDRAGDPITVRGGCEVRGAAEDEDLQRQQAKIVAAVNALDAEVVSLEEIENSAKFGKDRDQALSELVDALNAAAGSAIWAYVPSPAQRPAVGDEDVIRTAFIYQPAALGTVGESVILQDEENFDNAREPLAQTFRPAGGDAGEDFTVIVNHFKSKGSAPSTGPNADAGDGAGGWNADRTAQAQALVAFAERLKSTQGTDRVLLTGDFNSYDQEDPMRVLHDAGYTNLAPAGEHSYAYGGMVGSLDHVLASPAAAGTVTGSDIWEINAHESVGLEYSRHNHNVVDLYAADPYRASDHNPEIVGLALAGAEPAGPQKPGRGNSGEHPGKGLREHADDRAREVLHRRFG
ncbi:ExeM/NucH family extracellular endonuclease [Kocuria sp. CPCC 205263]|uniref:ExeM/NucH family extracellular endonuclease n=1 Tax=Kocuria sp. CPCC 205263 TaxID=3073555 RepID=UPI0034D49166